MKDLDEMRRRVGEWAKRTFPGHTDEGTLLHVREDLAELVAPHYEHGTKPRSVDEEAA